MPIVHANKVVFTHPYSATNVLIIDKTRVNAIRRIDMCNDINNILFQYQAFT